MCFFVVRTDAHTDAAYGAPADVFVGFHVFRTQVGI